MLYVTLLIAIFGHVIIQSRACSLLPSFLLLISRSDTRSWFYLSFVNFSIPCLGMGTFLSFIKPRIGRLSK